VFHSNLVSILLSFRDMTVEQTTDEDGPRSATTYRPTCLLRRGCDNNNDNNNINNFNFLAFKPRSKVYKY